MAMAATSAVCERGLAGHLAAHDRACGSRMNVTTPRNSGTFPQAGHGSVSALKDGFAKLSLHVLSRSSGKVSKSRSVVYCGSGNGAINGAVYKVNGVANGAIHQLSRGMPYGEVKERAVSEPVVEIVASEMAIAAPTTAPSSTSNGSVAKEISIEVKKDEVTVEETKSTRSSIGFTSVEEALDVVKQGKVVILVNEEKDPGGVGNFFVAGSVVTEDSLAFMVNYGSGIILSPSSPAILDRLNLPLMVGEDTVTDVQQPAFTVTVDAKDGTSTGISAADRALTIRRMAEADSQPQDFRRPGHVIPLRSSKDVIGTAEAAVGLAELAGLPAVGALCAVTRADGQLADLPALHLFARQHGIHLVSVADLVRYKKEMLVKRTAVARLPTKWGNFQIYSYTSLADGIEHVAMVKGEIGSGEDILCRVHSECLTGDIFGSQKCDCGPQLEQAMQRIEREGRGVLVYMRGHEGRGIGLGAKLKAYNLQDNGRDTVEANVELGLPIDSREYDVSAQILQNLGVRSLRLMTNNPAKYHALMAQGIMVKKRVPVSCPITLENKRYLDTKRQKMGHLYGSDLTTTFGKLLEEVENTIG